MSHTTKASVYAHTPFTTLVSFITPHDGVYLRHELRQRHAAAAYYDARHFLLYIDTVPPMLPRRVIESHIIAMPAATSAMSRRH